MGDRIPIFSLHTVLLPGTDLPIHVFEDRYLSLVEHSLGNGHTFGVVYDEHRVGTLARICGHAQLPDGRYLLEVEGTRRFEVRKDLSGPYPMAEVRFLTEAIGHFGDARSASRDVARLFHLYRTRMGDGDIPLNLAVDPVTRSYVVAAQMRIEPVEKQQLLEASTAADRLEDERDILLREITTLDSLRARR